MLKGALRSLTLWNLLLQGMNKVEHEVFSIFKKVYLTLDVKNKKLLSSVRVSKGTAVKWAAEIIKKVKLLV